MNPLGTWLSWTRDATLAGLLMSLSMNGVVLALFAWDVGGRPAQLLEVLGVFVGLGLGVGLALGPLGWALATASWRWPPLTLAIGPVLGSCCSLATIFAYAQRGFPQMAPGRWLLLLGFGAFVAAPPWMAYVGVRARGRAGWPIVLALPLWGVFSLFLLVVGRLLQLSMGDP